MKKILLVLSIALSFQSLAQKDILIVGTYTTGKSEGIYLYSFDNKTGETAKLSSAKSKNPSYVAVAPNGKIVYAVTELDGNNGGGGISAFSFNKDSSSLTLINTESSGGASPCYVSVDKTGKWLVAGNYNGGNIAVLPILENGSIGKATLTQHYGNSTHKTRQTKPHVHCTYFSADNKFLFVPDLGLDKTMIYAFDAKTGTITPTKQAFAPSDTSTGPRHITFSTDNKFAYLIEELSATVQVFKHKKGKLTSIQKIKATPPTYIGTQGSADIHVSPDGRFLYCSNRGESNSITCFRIQEDGKLVFLYNTPTLGLTPRNFNFDATGNFLLVANQKSDNVVIFKVDRSSGYITDTGKRIDVGNPVCLKWL
jgi:6-phosphogluconolactonase